MNSREKIMSHSVTMPRSSLASQLSIFATISTKIELSMLSTALVDALGGPAEFQARFSFPFLSEMIPNDNFGLPSGVWTDDTSMMLCLAESLSTFSEKEQGSQWNSSLKGRREKGGFDEIHQLTLYTQWEEKGYLSAVDSCFDVGTTINAALCFFKEERRRLPHEILLRIKNELSDERYSGNGSLMRILPVGLAYWQDEGQARAFARRSSLTTHPSPLCLEVCEMWIGVISLILQKTTRNHQEPFSKLDLLEYIANFPYTHRKLRNALAMPSNVPLAPRDQVEREDWFFRHHPLLQLIGKTQGSKIIDMQFSYYVPSSSKLPSSGYVLHSAVAAFYCFFATSTFEDGALMAVNLGSDADTVGAIYAGLAGCWYSSEDEGVDNGVFWTKRVREWKGGLVKRDVVEKVAQHLVAFEQRVAEGHRSSHDLIS